MTPIVIKFGGSAMTDLTTRREVASLISELAEQGRHPIIVHGGGPFIKAALAKAKIESHFVRGLRVTTAESISIIEASLTILGKQLAEEIGQAIGLTGRDAKILQASKTSEELGLVGTMQAVNKALLIGLLKQGITPVLACLASSPEGLLNVNADHVAAAVASRFKSPVVFLSDVVGVLEDIQDSTSLIKELSHAEITARIADGRIQGGMIPKVESACHALEQGADYAVIADGRSRAKVAEALRGKAGTRVVPNPA